MASRDFVLEIQTEELPSGPLYGAIEQLAVRVPELLRDARLEYGEVRVFGGPRRLVVAVSNLAEHQDDRTLRAKGPAAKAAFDDAGNATKAAIGFARGKGVNVADLEVVEDGGGSYVYAVIEEIGGPALEVLPSLFSRLIEQIEWPKSMRWGSGEARFSRPVRGLLGLFGGDVVPVAFGGLVAGRFTEGHRFLARGPWEVPAAQDYALALERGMVIADQDARAALIREGIEAAAGKVAAERDAEITAVVPEKTFAEVVNLVEWPTVAAGSFDEEFLEVPREVLENAMESHQRYFPLEDAAKRLLPKFVVAHNGDPARTDEIVAGHERVIRARLSDAAFFYREDLHHSLESRVAELDQIVFQERLGSLKAKSERVEKLAERLGGMVGAGSDVYAYAARAGHLSKADLVTSVVVEFPALQGVMGRYYALASGEDAAVADAILEHYQPRFAGDELPATEAGRLVAVADKLDTIVGIFAAGLAPTGSADPYALRRSSIGILQMMLAGLRLTLTEAIAAALEGYEGVLALDVQAVGTAVQEFILGRLDVLLRERGNAYDTVAAVLAVVADDPFDAGRRSESLTTFRAASDDMEDLSVAFTRAKNLAQPDLGVATDASIMDADERALGDALDDGEARIGDLMDQEAYSAVLETFAAMRPAIDAFFDNVLVMDEDPVLRENRLKLLNRFVALFRRFADFSQLSG
jgi:glycyl-tRNA synthetase beta chain